LAARRAAKPASKSGASWQSVTGILGSGLAQIGLSLLGPPRADNPGRIC
jgi:hypothetical protein